MIKSSLATVVRFAWHVLRSCNPLTKENRTIWKWHDCWAMAERDGQPDFVRDLLCCLRAELLRELSSCAKVRLVPDLSGYRVAVGRRGLLEDPERVTIRVVGQNCVIVYERWDYRGLEPYVADIWQGQRLGKAEFDLADPDSIWLIVGCVRNIVAIPQVFIAEDKSHV